MNELREIEAIKRLKYKYFRTLDCKQWQEMGECFTEDATASYASGKYAFEGRRAIMAFMEQALTRRVISMHHGHHPEIELASETRATGKWYLEDKVIHLDDDTTLTGTGIYEDVYVKVDGEWKFEHTGYERIFEEIFDRADLPSLKLTSNRFA